MNAQPLTAHDRRVLQAQLGRPPRGDIYVASRCPYGEVEVVATAPLLDGDEPFPTLYWLTCPVLRSEVGRLEAGDLREKLRGRMGEEAFARELRQAEAEYLEERQEMARALRMEETEALFRGRDGVGGGPAGSLKCLHAHYAHWRARGTNPVGREMSALIGDAQREHCKGTCP
jgi:uncharacterized protein